MATVLENATNTIYDTAQREAERHNQLIKERYEQLMSTEEDQLNESLSGADFSRAYASTLAPERPAEISRPQTPSYTHTRVDSPLFTTETLEKTISYGEQAPVEAAMPVAEVQVAPTVSIATERKAAQLSISNFAKAVAAAFAVLVIVMLSVIAINSRTIQQKNVKIRRLEEKRQELMEESEEIQSRIEEVRSFEYVKNWAESNGFVFD